MEIRKHVFAMIRGNPQHHYFGTSIHKPEIKIQWSCQGFKVVKAGYIMDGSDQLSPREKAVIELLLKGKSNKQIAFLLHLTPRTIEYHLTNIYNKLGVSSRSEAIVLLTQYNSTSPDQPENNALRESTVDAYPEVQHNEAERVTIRRHRMDQKKFILIGIGLLAILAFMILYLANLNTADRQTAINPASPDRPLVLSPSSISTQPESLSGEQLGLQTLVDFLNHLNQGEFDKAADMYGGSYEMMVEQNPDIDPNDRVSLLKYACTINGVQCLKVNSAGPASAGPYDISDMDNRTEFKYQVEFLNNDGSVYVLGPCCGGNATDSPPQSIFYFTVVKVEGNRFVVMDMPPYSP